MTAQSGVPVSAAARARQGRVLLFEPTDIARAFQVARVAVACAISIVSAVLAVAWEWSAGGIVVLAALLVALDATIRWQRGNISGPLVLLLADVTAVGAGMVLSGLPDLVVVAPYGYMLTASALVLSRRQGWAMAAYLALWTGAILVLDVGMFGAALEPAQEGVVVGLGILIYLGATFVLTSVAAAAVRERHALDERLHASRTQLRTVVGGAPVVLFAVDRAGTFTLSEGAGLAVLGLEAGEVVGRSVAEVYRNAPHVVDLIHAALESEEEIESVVDLGHVAFDVRMSPQRNAVGEVIGTIGIATDVTDRVHAQREVERRIAVEQIVARASAELIALRPGEEEAGILRVLEMVGEFAECDQAHLVAPGAAHTPPVAHSWMRAAPPGAAAASVEDPSLPWMEARLRRGDFIGVDSIDDLPPAAAAEKELCARLGIASVAVAPLNSELVSGAYVVFATVGRSRRWTGGDAVLFRVVGEMLANVLAHRRARTKLEELVMSKDQFVASVSHELRTPLASVLGLSEELRDRPEDFEPGEAHELHAILAEQAAELSAIVEDLLVVARADIGQVAVELRSVELLDEIAAVVGALRPTDRARISIEGSGVRASADGHRVRQVARNLVVNALRYGGVHIEIVARCSAGWAVIEVRDDGDGVPEGQEDEIFEPYVHAAEMPGLPGSIGLGLTVARKLTRLMGGELVYERCDGWSIFRVYLPAVADASADAWPVAG